MKKHSQSALTGTKTEQYLKTAAQGEASAFTKYSLYSDIADEEGYQEITVKTKGTEHCRLLLDSKVYELAGPFSFKIRKAGFKFITVYPPERNFFDAIREKLMWGLDIRHRHE